VLEEVGEAILARGLVLGADVVIDVHRDDRGAVILVKDDLEAVVEDEALEGELDARTLARGRRARRGRRVGEPGAGERQGAEDQGEGEEAGTHAAGW
jgi:hypothetical protein